MSQHHTVINDFFDEAPAKRVLRGDKTKKKESGTHIIEFPGGAVEVARLDDGSYWAHIIVNRGQVLEGFRGLEAALGRVVDSRVDWHEALGFARGQALQLARMRAALDAMRVEEFSENRPQNMREIIPNPFQAIPAGSPVTGDGRNDAGPEGNPRPSSGAGLKPSAVASADGTLNSAARKMLAVLDTNPPVRRTWAQVATLAGLKARGGHFNAGKKTLVEGGYLIDHPGGLIEHANPSPGAGEPPTPAEVVERWCAVLSGAAPKILRFLFDWSSTGGLTRDFIAEQLKMQPRGGHWNAAWKELRDNGLVQFDGPIVRLHPDIFGGSQ